MTPIQTKKTVVPLWGQKFQQDGRTLARVFRPRLWFWSAIASVLPAYTLPRLRTSLYRLGGCRIGARAGILGGMILMGEGDITARLHLAEGSRIAPHVTFGLDAEITVGRNASIGPHVTLNTATHAVGFGSQRMTLDMIAKPIIIEDGVWVGTHSLIMPGVKLGQGCVISGGSVVSQDVPPNVLVAGNPATVQQTLPFGNR